MFINVWRRLWVNGLRDESGFTLIELVAALAILSVAFFALAMGASTGLKLLAQGKQRAAASEIANARLEHLRNIPYELVALQTPLTQSGDENDPDFYVSADGSQYDHTGSGDFENVLVDTGAGQVAHLETPVEIGETTLSVHQYVTWVDDPTITGTEDYKRLTVVVTYIAAIPVGRTRHVRVSALFTTDGVTISGSAPGSTQGVTSTPSPNVEPPSPECAGDTTGPTGTFTILSGTGALREFTNSQNVTISLAPSDPCTPIEYAFSNNGTTFGLDNTYDAANPSATWTLTAGDGQKKVWTRYIDGLSNSTILAYQTIRLDQTLPTTPTGFGATISCAGVNRTVSLSWSASVDAHFLGHRVYKSVNSGTYEVMTTTGDVFASDTHLKTLDSVSYRVVGYDKAGNESTPSDVVTLAKNQCS